MAFANPNTGPKYSIIRLKEELKKTEEFAVPFAEQLILANQGIQSAIDCIDSYVYPTDQELEDLGIHRSQWGPLRKCTDLGLLVQVITEHEAHPQPVTQP